MTPDRWIDLGLNLVAGLIEIALTVFFIDRLIRMREEKRWRISKQIVYAKLFRSVNELLEAIVPKGLRGKVKRVCLFDKRIPIFYFEYPDFSNEKIYGLSNKEYAFFGDLFLNMGEHIENLLKDMHEISSNNDLIVDPDFHAYLSVLDVFLTTYEDDFRKAPEEKDPTYYLAYFELLSSVIRFRDYLTKDAITITKKEYLDGLLFQKYGYY